MKSNEWIKKAEQEFHRFAKRRQLLTGEQFQLHCIAIDFPEPGHPNWRGIVIRNASSYGWIKRSGVYHKATLPKNRGSELPVWMSLVT